MKALKKLGIVLLSIVVVISLFFLVVNLIPAPKVESTPFTKTTHTLISAHRGGAELNPENTEMAFDHVILETSYCDAVEIDIKLTKDGRIVIVHDDTINAYALDSDAEPVSIIEHTYDELSQYNLGYNFYDREGNRPYENLSLLEAKDLGLTIMTLDDFLDKYMEAREFLFYLEIKEKGDISIELSKKIIEMLNQDKYLWWKERTMLISISDAAIDYIANNAPDFYTGAVGYKIAGSIATSLFMVDAFFKPNFHCVQTALTNSIGSITIDCSTKRFIKSAHKHNQSVCYWGVNDVDAMKRLVENGADAITTDAPDKLAEILGIAIN